MTSARIATSPSDALGSEIADIKARISGVELLAHTPCGGGSGCPCPENVLKTGDTMSGALTIGPDAVTPANPSSLLHVRKDTPGGKGGEISIINYSNTASSHAALNFGVDASSYGSDTGNAQIRATNTNGTSMATELGMYQWDGGGFGRRLYIDGAGNTRFDRTPPGMSWPLVGCPVGSKYTLGWNAAQVAFSSANTWQTIISTGATVPAGCSVVMVQGLATFYTQAAGPFLIRTIDSVGNASAGLTLYTNYAYSHLHIPYSFAMSTSPGSRTFSLQVYGAGLVVVADANDAATITVETT